MGLGFRASGSGSWTEFCGVLLILGLLAVALCYIDASARGFNEGCSRAEATAAFENFGCGPALLVRGCVCVCVCLCVYIHIHIHIYIYIYVHTHTCIHIHIHIRIRLHLQIHVHIHMQIHIDICMYIYIYILMYLIYICTYKG